MEIPYRFFYRARGCGCLFFVWVDTCRYPRCSVVSLFKWFPCHLCNDSPLVLLGKYHYILEAVNNKDFETLLIFTAGALVGLLSFVRVLGWLLKRYHDLTMAILVGLMLGSLRKIWPWKQTLTTFIDHHGKEVPALQVNILPPGLDTELVLALLFMCLGFAVVTCLNYWELKKN